MNEQDRVSATRREPQQARSRFLVASIREACRRILDEGDEAELTVKRIAEVAGVTVGSFYQYYENKEAVLLDLLLESAPDEAERIAAETRYLATLRWESLEGTLGELVAVICERHQRLLARHGDIYRRYHRRIGFEALIQHRVQRYSEVVSLEPWLLQTLRRHRPELDDEGAAMRAFLIAGTLTEMTARALDEQPQWLGSERFRQELHHLLLGCARGQAENEKATATPAVPRPREEK